LHGLDIEERQTAMTFVKENKALVRAFIDAANACDISLAGTFFSQDFIDHEAPSGVILT
jgi:hypothetical protein